MAFTSAGNVVSSSKLVTQSHVQPATLQKQSMRIQTTGQDLDLILTFRITVSRLTRFFTCNQRLSSTVLSSRAHFFSNGAPNDSNKNSPGQCNPNFPIRCADNSEKMIQFVTIHRISQLQVTKCYDPARQPTRYRSNITRTAMNELLGVQTRGLDRFPTRRKDFFLTFPVFVSVKPLTDTMNMHVREASK